MFYKIIDYLSVYINININNKSMSILSITCNKYRSRINLNKRYNSTEEKINDWLNLVKV